MIDVIGFWSVVTIFVVTPIWFFGFRITRGILSIAKMNAPEIPYELRKERSWSTWDCQLYPQWAHNLTKVFGGGWMDTGGVAILGVLAFVPTVTILVGIVDDHHTVIGLISDVATLGAKAIGWMVVVLFTGATSFFGISKASRLVGLVQLQEMKEKHNEGK